MSETPVTPEVRRGRRPRDIVISLGVLIVPIIVIIALYRVFGGDPTHVVDPGPAYTEAATAGQFAVEQPRGLPAGWKAVSSTVRRQAATLTLRVGYVGPGGAALQLIETNVPVEDVLRDEVDGRPGGTLDLGGRSWQRYTGTDGRNALALLEPKRTILVLGKGDEAELRTLATSLTPS